MKNVRDELQHIILGDGPAGKTDHIKKIQIFLRGYAEAGGTTQKQQRFKRKETAALIALAKAEDLFYENDIDESNFIAAGAEQRVYQYNESHIIKTNGALFYEYWLDYFNSLLIHNYFFPTTAYTFQGFKVIGDELYAIVQQRFIASSEPTNLNLVKQFLEHNQFQNKRNNDYISSALGIVFEDLHDENVLSNDGRLFFIDTIFYLMPDFYQK